MEGHAVVTGASSGIGRAIAEQLLDGGWQVTGISRRDPLLAHARFRSVKADLGAPADREKAVAALSGVTALVHAAGILRTGALGPFSEDDGEIMWRVNVDSAAFLAGHLAPRLPSGGRIVLVGSRLSAGAANRSLYAATKAALVALARSWAIELVDRGITVNVVAPGATDTPMLRDPQRGSDPPRLPPIGRLITPQEVAATVAFLMSPQAAAITGQEIVICGGASLGIR
jgi:3-oxoacyl-[acyl-carrier protein] reductase